MMDTMHSDEQDQQGIILVVKKALAEGKEMPEGEYESPEGMACPECGCKLMLKKAE